MSTWTNPPPSAVDGPHGEERNTGPGTVPPPPSRWLILTVLLVAVAVLGFGAYGHWRTETAAAETQQDAISYTPTIRSITAKPLTDPIETTLPGQTEAFDRANIYARATGYVAERFADIGTPVKKGDLLLRIAAPDLDRQLDQARAQLDQVKATLAQAQAQVSQAEANLKVGNLNFERSDALVKKGFDTYQNHDNQQANVATQRANLEAAKAGVKVAEANIEAQQATVNRLATLAEFENVRAPFDGVVSVRNVDVGDLVNADQGAGTPMFTLVRDDVLRVSVNVPQGLATLVRDGLPARVKVAQIPGRVFEGKVARNAGALLASSRTLAVEVDVQNADHVLRAGLFVNVSFSVPRDHPVVQVPAEALIFNAQGLQVATISDDNSIRLQPVGVRRDLGAVVEIDQGLRGGERIALNPPSSLVDGAKVKLRGDEKVADRR